MTKRYLTKSRFKLALECPAKLYYTGKKEYANSKLEDSFLESLAEGGFQVGELAKCYFPEGYNLSSLDHKEALNTTNQLLLEDSITIYEAAVVHENYFIRIDILQKEGKSLRLFEVKAKSFDPADANPFINTKGNLDSGWESYLMDVAFQKYVVMQAFPAFQVEASLMLADKSAHCPTEGLNQKFRIIKDQDGGRKKVVVSLNLSPEDLSPPILCRVPVDEECLFIYQKNYGSDGSPRTFSELLSFYGENYSSETRIETPVSTACGKCEFTTTPQEEAQGLKSGFKECWKKQLFWKDADFADPTIFDIWNFRKKDKLIEDGRLKMKDVSEADISPKGDDMPGLSFSQRQWLQVSKHQEGDYSAWIDKDNLKKEMDSWVYPFHFIDFETSMTAIPLNKGRSPYEGLAFQFSHHTVDEDGHIEHRGEFLNVEPGVFPSYQFLRALKAELTQDEGTVFRYATHENTFLNTIFHQLRDDPDPPSDAEELCDFIKQISHSGAKSLEMWQGPRDMVDQLDLVKRYYYDPAMGGSNSIKKVLPAILNGSDYLKEKYSRPIYGAGPGIAGAITSFNFKDWQWIVFEEGRVKDPYKLLPPMFLDVDEKKVELLSEETELQNGGAALTAYARMQFEEMSDYEREEIRKALLKYCELDTMAMVMIYEGWRAML